MRIVCSYLPVRGQPVWPAKPTSRQARRDDLSNQQKARTLVDQMIQALGGQAYLTAQDYYAEGRSGSFHNETLQGTVCIIVSGNGRIKDRIELTKQRDVVQLYLGD